ncbi:hypothetical protein K7432_007583 [Basidiobolus ranarum]|uniref:Uncharacterized protein n=1 Tax=Basidiobolus ranarum TaxID=34480 RepID=A0ABR2WTB3_9FUNG
MQQQKQSSHMFVNNPASMRPESFISPKHTVTNGRPLDNTGIPQPSDNAGPLPISGSNLPEVSDTGSTSSRASSVPANLPMGPPASQITNLIAGPTGAAVYKLIQYGEFLAPRPESDKLDIEQWRKFIQNFYVETGSMKYTIRNIQFKDTRSFELSASLLPRYYVVNFESGVTGINLLMKNPREFVLPTGSHVVECSRTSFIYHFNSGIQITANGILKGTFTPQLKIEQLEFHTSQHNELIPRSLLPNPLLYTHNQDSKGGSTNEAVLDLPETPVNEYGVPPKAMRCLEISEVICHMRELISFSLQSNSGPIQSLQHYAETARYIRQGSTPIQSPVPSHAILKQMMEGIPGVPFPSPSSIYKQPALQSSHNINSGASDIRYELSPSPSLTSPRVTHVPSPVLGKHKATFAADRDSHKKKRANSQQGSPKAKKAKPPTGARNRRGSSMSATPMGPGDKDN